MTQEKALSGRQEGRFAAWVVEVRKAINEATLKQAAGRGEGRVPVVAPAESLRRLRDELTPEEWYRIDVHSPTAASGPAYRWDSLG